MLGWQAWRGHSCLQHRHSCRRSGDCASKVRDESRPGRLKPAPRHVPRVQVSWATGDARLNKMRLRRCTGRVIGLPACACCGSALPDGLRIRLNAQHLIRAIPDAPVQFKVVEPDDTDRKSVVEGKKV